MEGFRQKTQDELERQINGTTNTLNESIVPPSEKENINNLSIKEIKERFQLRYEAYLKTLRSRARDVDISGVEREEMANWIHALNNLDTYIENHRANEDERTLREKQFTVFEAIRNFLEKGNKEGYIKLPTGSGKTVIFSELIEALGLRTLIVVPTQILLEQTEKELDHFTEDFDFGKFYAHAKELDKDNLITTYQSMVMGVKDGTIDPLKYDCIILDEAHKALSDGRTDVIKQFNGAIKIGFTATPTYSEDKNVKDLLDTEIYSLPIKEAVREGVICGFSVILVQSNIDLDGVKITSTGEYKQEDLEKAVNKEARNKAGVEIYKKVFEGDRAVVYCCGVEHAKKVSELFNEQGTPSAFVSGYQDNNERQKVLSDFKSGKIKVLCNADILIEGFNEKRASVCINLRPTLSRVVAEQRGGRVLRLDDDNPNKIAKIVDFIDVYNTNRGSLSFADIVGEASVVRKPDEKDAGMQGAIETVERVAKPNIGLDFQITTEAKEIMRVLNEFGRVGKEKIEFTPFEQLQIEVIEAKIESERHYHSEYKNHKGWPSKPNATYKDQWRGWENFLGKEYISYDQLKGEVEKAEIANQRQYRGQYKNHKGWPSSPEEIYKDRWHGWEEFLGKEFITFEQFTKEVGEAKIVNILQYKKEYKNHKGWPSNPNATYKNRWGSWKGLFGQEKVEFIPYDQLKKEVGDRDIKNSNHYHIEYKNHKGWPSSPDLTYKGQWSSWEEFLGKEKKKFITYSQLQEEIRAAKIESRKQYLDEYKKRKNWPSNPNATYKDQWHGWEEFLGIGFIPYNKLQGETRRAKIRSQKHYHSEYKNHKGWPSNPNMTYKSNWPGWQAFLSEDGQ